MSPLCALGMLSRHSPAAPPVPPRLRAGVCGMLDQRCSPALTPGDGNVILPGSLTPTVCNGYPSAHTAPLRAPQQRGISRDPSPQPCPGAHLHPIPISLALWGCSHCLHALLGDLFPTFICTELEHSSPPHTITASHSPSKKAEVFLV